MTSGVKQALPQLLMPKAGVEGKAARGRAPKGDFAEALGIGKAVKQPKPGEAEKSDAGPRVAWPQLAARFGSTIASTPRIVAPLESGKEPASETSEEIAAAGDASEQPAPVQRPDTVPSIVVAQVNVIPVAEPPKPATPKIPVNRDSQTGDGLAAHPALPETAPQVGNDVILPPASTEPATVDTAGAAAKQPIAIASANASATKEAATEPVDPLASPAPRATIIAHQNIPAPIPPTAVVLVESIVAGDLLEPARTVLSLDAIHASAAPASAQSLKIQLHPAELGMVTATLRFAGEQLSIELQVENHEAYRRLASDSDAIAGSLRDLGYDIDRVTVLQPALAASSAGRSDAGASMPSPQGRSSEQFGSGMAGGGNGGAGGRQSETSGNPGRGGHPHSSGARENQESGLYI